ncbi:MAG: hypothetical protein JWN19_1284, partial [Arthrobacter sp.]|nr:hypothetical protein [Arthrobacter sp.]
PGDSRACSPRQCSGQRVRRTETGTAAGVAAGSLNGLLRPDQLVPDRSIRGAESPAELPPASNVKATTGPAPGVTSRSRPGSAAGNGTPPAGGTGAGAGASGPGRVGAGGRTSSAGTGRTGTGSARVEPPRSGVGLPDGAALAGALGVRVLALPKAVADAAAATLGLEIRVRCSSLTMLCARRCRVAGGHSRGGGPAAACRGSPSVRR